MPSDLSVHDNHLVAYTVHAKEKKIVFHTEFHERKPHEFTDVIFDDVLAYHFENDLFGTIIFDIKEVDLTVLLKDHAMMFEAGWRYGWPRGWQKEKEDIATYVKRLDLRAFEVASSYGMSGWVIAKHMEKSRKHRGSSQS